ncbi:MAG: GNAT family N-acetyltransferase [Gaiellaceae bacterium]
MWSSGDIVVVRELWKGRVWKARPWIVVQDAPGELVLWIPKGTPTKIPSGSGIPRDEWELEDGVFTRAALRVARPDRLHSILRFEGETGLEWYVNLERPLRRSRLGFDYLDRELDLLVRRDGTWEWLDEDEFEEAQALGVIAPEEAAAMREEGGRVLAEWPFPTSWEVWRPDPAWELPALPEGWDDVPAATLQTARLRLRPLDESDLLWFAELRMTSGHSWSQAAKRLSEALEHWSLHSFGKFAVLNDDDPVGVITLNFVGETLVGIGVDEVDLGWYVLPERWGEGIAAEAARSVVDWAHAQGIGPLVAYLRPANAASRRVAQKLGFVRVGDGRAKNGDAVEIYRQPSRRDTSGL